MNCLSTQGILVFQDSATIPCVLSPIRLQMSNLTRVVLFVSIPIAIIFLWLKAKNGERIFGDLLRILIVFVGLIGYDRWFMDGVSIIGAMAQSLYPSQLVLVFYERIWQSPLIPNSVGSFVSFLSDPMGIFYLILLDGLKVIVLAFSLVRYALLSFLYIVGPLLFAASIIPGFFFLVAQWSRNALEISLWLVFHNLLIGIFSSINLYQALSNGPVSTVLINRILEVGILFVLVLMILFVPILTHLLLDRSYEGIGSFVGPQAESLGRNLWNNFVEKPLFKGELPFGIGEFKSGTTTKDLGQGKRVYRKKQLRIGPMDMTSMIWSRTPKEKSPSSKGSDSQKKKMPKTKGTARTPRKRVGSKANTRKSGKKVLADHAQENDPPSPPKKVRRKGSAKVAEDNNGDKQ